MAQPQGTTVRCRQLARLERGAFLLAVAVQRGCEQRNRRR